MVSQWVNSVRLELDSKVEKKSDAGFYCRGTRAFTLYWSWVRARALTIQGSSFTALPNHCNPSIGSSRLWSQATLLLYIGRLWSSAWVVKGLMLGKRKSATA